MLLSIKGTRIDGEEIVNKKNSSSIIEHYFLTCDSNQLFFFFNKDIVFMPHVNHT